MVRRTRANAGKVTRHKPAEVEVRNIAHPKVWKTALAIAGGNASLIKVETATCVVVVLA